MHLMAVSFNSLGSRVYMKMTKRLPFSQLKVYERATFSVNRVYKRVRGWTLGQSHPLQNFVVYHFTPLL